MKKKIFFYILLTIFLLILGVLALIFFRPELLVNTKNLKYALEKTKILKTWSWKEGEMVWGYKKWNHRTFSGHFKDLCFHYESPAINLKTCLDEISWDVENFNLNVKTIKPLVLHSSLTEVALTESEKKEKSPPPEIWKYWEMLWSSLTPELDILFKEIKIKTGGKEYATDFKLIKKQKSLNAHAQKIHLWANPEKIEVFAPPEIELPKKIEGMRPLYLRNFKLVAKMKETGIPLEVLGSLEAAQIKVNAYLDLPIKEDMASVSFRKKFFLTVKANLRLPGLKKNLQALAPDPFKELPAPLNVMDGLINIDIKTEDQKEASNVLVVTKGTVDLSSPNQALKFDVTSEVPLDLVTFKPQSVLLGLEFHKVQLQLPRLSKKSPPPQLIPDGRFKNAPFKAAVEPKNKQKPLDITVNLQALNENAMKFRTNLLDEILKLNFDLKIVQGNLKEGYLSILPLKTSVFKRPIQVTQFKITFRHPVEPLLEAVIKFPLPEYKITLNLEGPISKPRYSFVSDPPLPQNDIFAVLLFGRPLSDLDPDDKTAAQKTNQILSQGILSLSVLYFLAGSPVEYVGYDPGSKNATAQFGLGNKTSLRVGGGQEGINSSAIRRSLGKGWYLDTSVQNSSDISSSDTRNYGVLLERIITY